MLYSAGKIVNWLRVKNNAYMHLNLMKMKLPK